MVTYDGKGMKSTIEEGTNQGKTREWKGTYFLSVFAFWHAVPTYGCEDWYSSTRLRVPTTPEEWKRMNTAPPRGPDTVEEREREVPHFHSHILVLG